VAKVKRSILGSIAEMIIHIGPYPKGFEAYGYDKLGRKIVLARRTELEPVILNGAEVAQCLADFAKEAVTLKAPEGKTEEFLPKSV
jgi:hypothetical protein